MYSGQLLHELVWRCHAQQPACIDYTIGSAVVPLLAAFEATVTIRLCGLNYRVHLWQFVKRLLFLPVDAQSMHMRQQQRQEQQP